MEAARGASQGMFFGIFVLNRVSIFVLNRVRVWGAGLHLPIQGYLEYSHPHPRRGVAAMISHDFIQDVCTLLFLACWRILGAKWGSWGWWHMMTLMYVRRLFWLYRNSWSITGKTSHYMPNSASGQDKSNSALWLATRAGKMELSCPLWTTRCIPQEKFPRKPYNKSFIDQRWLDIGLVIFLRVYRPRLRLCP